MSAGADGGRTPRPPTDAVASGNREEPMPRDDESTLYEMQAEIAKALAHPIRLQVLDQIGTGEVAYGTLLARLGISKTNLSQHLAVLRRSGLVLVRRDRSYVHYRLTFPEIKTLCASMRDILARHLALSSKHARLLKREVG
jgi:DNA-binding transcriptional ArsR family regulator